MKLRRKVKKLERKIEDGVAEVTGCSCDGSHLLRNVGLFAAGVAVLGVGVAVGRELRARYKFNRRTPYDFYAHAGDRNTDVEFGVGI